MDSVLNQIDWSLAQLNHNAKVAKEWGDTERVIDLKRKTATLLRERGDVVYSSDQDAAQAAYLMAGLVELAAEELEETL